MHCGFNRTRYFRGVLMVLRAFQAVPSATVGTGVWLVWWLPRTLFLHHRSLCCAAAGFLACNFSLALLDISAHSCTWTFSMNSRAAAALRFAPRLASATLLLCVKLFFPFCGFFGFVRCNISVCAPGHMRMPITSAVLLPPQACGRRRDWVPAGLTATCPDLNTRARSMCKKKGGARFVIMMALCVTAAYSCYGAEGYGYL